MMGKILFVSLLFFSATVTAQNVRPVKLDELYKRVKSGNDTTYIINFWATWCVPCLQELPHFEKISSQYKTDKLKVILVSMDFQSKLETAVVPFIRKKKIKNEVFLLDETDQQEFINRIDSTWSGALPATLFIYKNKRTFFEKEFSYEELLTEYKNIQTQ